MIQDENNMTKLVTKWWLKFHFLLSYIPLKSSYVTKKSLWIIIYRQETSCPWVCSGETPLSKENHFGRQVGRVAKSPSIWRDQRRAFCSPRSDPCFFDHLPLALLSIWKSPTASTTNRAHIQPDRGLPSDYNLLIFHYSCLIVSLSTLCR